MGPDAGKVATRPVPFFRDVAAAVVVRQEFYDKPVNHPGRPPAGTGGSP